MSQEQVIRRTTKNKRGVITLVIPRKFTKEFGLTESTDIVIVKQPTGLFIKKLRTDNYE